jgi:hypothetical protein
MEAQKARKGYVKDSVKECGKKVQIGTQIQGGELQDDEKLQLRWGTVRLG